MLSLQRHHITALYVWIDDNLPNISKSPLGVPPQNNRYEKIQKQLEKMDQSPEELEPGLMIDFHIPKKKD